MGTSCDYLSSRDRDHEAFRRVFELRLLDVGRRYIEHSDRVLLLVVVSCHLWGL